MSEIIRIYRPGGMGDELCLTPSYRVLKRMGYSIEAYGNAAPDILKYNPNVDKAESVGTRLDIPGEYKYIKWHNEAEYGYDMHLVDFYVSQLGIEADSHILDLYLGDEDIEWARFTEALPRPIICYNIYGGWLTKAINFTTLMHALDKKYTVIQIGNNPPYQGVGYNMVGSIPSIRCMGALLGNSDLYIGNDAGPFHVASAVGCRSIILFTSTDPACHIHSDRDIPVYNEECYGCYNKYSYLGVIEGKCMRNDYICMRLNGNDIYNLAEDILNRSNT